MDASGARGSFAGALCSPTITGEQRRGYVTGYEEVLGNGLSARLRSRSTLSIRRTITEDLRERLHVP